MKTIYRFKKILILSIAFVIFSSSSALAIIPLLIYAAAWVDTLVVVGLTWYAEQSLHNAAANTNGDVALQTKATYLDLSVSGFPVQKQADVSVIKTMAQIKTAVDANPTKYPKLKAALTPGAANANISAPKSPLGNYPIVTRLPVENDVTDVPAGDWFPAGRYKFTNVGSMHVVTGTGNLGGYAPICVVSTQYVGGVQQAFPGVSVTCYDGVDSGNQVNTTVSAVPATTPGEFVTAIGGTVVNPDVVKEMEALIPATGGVSTSTRRASTDPASSFTAPLYTLPIAPTNTQITGAGGVPVGDPSTGANGGTGGGLTQSQTTQAIKDALDAEKGSAPAVPGAYGDGTSFDFGARFNTFVNDMKTSGLFSLPGQLLGNIPAGGSSSFNVSFGRMGSTTFDLASFDASIAIMRSLVLCVFSIAGFRIVTLKGGSG